MIWAIRVLYLPGDEAKANPLSRASGPRIGFQFLDSIVSKSVLWHLPFLCSDHCPIFLDLNLGLLVSSCLQLDVLRDGGLYLKASMLKFLVSGQIWYIIITLALTGILRPYLFWIIFIIGPKGLLTIIAIILQRCGPYFLILILIHRMPSPFRLIWTTLCINTRCIGSKDLELNGCKQQIKIPGFSMQ